MYMCEFESHILVANKGTYFTKVNICVLTSPGTNVFLLHAFAIGQSGVYKQRYVTKHGL